MAGKSKSERFNFTDEFWIALKEVYPQKGGSSILSKRFGIPSATVSAKAKEKGIRSNREITQKFYRESVKNGYFERVLREWGTQEGGFERIGELFGIHSGTVRSKARKLEVLTDAMSLIAYHRESLRQDFFKVLDGLRAYILGYLYADGSIREDCESGIPDALQLRCKREDEGLIIQIRDILGSKHSIIRGEVRNKDGSVAIRKDGSPIETTTIVICSRVLVDDLITLYGVYPQKTYLDPPFPEWVTIDLLPHFVRGVFDGDGCCWMGSKRGYREYVLYYLGTELFISGLKSKIASTIGLNCGELNGSTGVKYISWTSLEDICKLYNWMYPYKDVSCLPRKKKYLEMMLSGDIAPEEWGEPMDGDGDLLHL